MRPEERLDEEIGSHLQLLAAEYRRRGLNEAEASLAARRDFGSIQVLKEAYRDERGGRWWNDWRGDVRYGVRVLSKAPIFSAIAVLTLGLGIGANTAIFSIINGLFLRQLPVAHPEQLVELDGVPHSLSALDRLRQRPEIFAGVAASEMTQFNIGSGADAAWVDGMWASAGFIETVGVRLVAGRAVTAADDRPGGGADGVVALLSERFARRRFGAAAAAIGQRLTVNRLPVTVIGVTGGEFYGLRPGRSFDVLAPMGQRRAMYSVDLFGSDIGTVVARLRPGIGIDEANERLRRAHGALRESMVREGVIAGGDEMERPITATSLRSPEYPARHSPYAQPLTILMALVALVLLIACANLANLLIARATARRQELAVRRALGATRLRLVRQLVAESAVLAVAGAGIGILFALWASRFMVTLLGAESVFSVGRMMFGPANLAVDLSLDWRVLGFTALVAMATVFLFGTAPAAIGSRVAPIQAMKEHAQNTPDRRPAAYAGLVIGAQVAVSLVLLVGALLLGRTFASVSVDDRGFEPDRALSIDVDPPRGLDTREAVDHYVRAVEALRRVAGIEAAGFSEGALIGGLVLGMRTTEWSETSSVRPIGTGWLAAMGVPLLAGRDFTASDRRGAPGVAIVNEAFARRFLRGANPIGHVVMLAGQDLLDLPQLTVVGYVRDIITSGRAGSQPQVFVPMAQADPEGDFLRIALEEGGLTIVVRSSGDAPMALRQRVGEALEGVHPGFGLTFRTVRDELDGLVTTERVLALLSGFFGAVGLVLAAIGLYGVTAYAVGRRHREIGVRLVLGASRGTVIGMVLARAGGLIAAGVVVGTVASLWLSRFLAALLFGVEPQDPLTLAGSTMILAVVGLVAAAIPALRAATIDPADVLRDA